MKKIIFLLIILFTVVTYNFAITGESSGAFLMGFYSAKTASLGEANIAKADDVTGILYNPAGLSQIEKYEIGLTYNKNIVDISNTYFSFGIPLEEVGVIGIVFAYSNYGKINNAVSEEKVLASDITGIVSYSKKIMEKLMIGINFKYFNSTIGSYSANSISGDLGVIYKISDIIQTGLSVKNIGTGLKYDTETTPLPIKIGSGIDVKILDTDTSNIEVLGDVNYILTEKDIYAGLGVEYIYAKMFSLRAGYKYEQNSIGGLTIGAGINYPLSSKVVISLDYAYLPQIWDSTTTDSSHIVSLLLKF